MSPAELCIVYALGCAGGLEISSVLRILLCEQQDAALQVPLC